MPSSSASFAVRTPSFQYFLKLSLPFYSIHLRVQKWPCAFLMLFGQEHFLCFTYHYQTSQKAVYPCENGGFKTLKSPMVQRWAFSEQNLGNFSQYWSLIGQAIAFRRLAWKLQVDFLLDYHSLLKLIRFFPESSLTFLCPALFSWTTLQVDILFVALWNTSASNRCDWTWHNKHCEDSLSCSAAGFKSCSATSTTNTNFPSVWLAPTTPLVSSSTSSPSWPLPPNVSICEYSSGKQILSKPLFLSLPLEVA